MTKRLIELMGGEIGVESVLGEGSIFWIEVNLTDKPKTVPAIATAQPTGIDYSKPNLPACTVLYIEDNPANLMLVEELIARRSDLRLLTATDAMAGIKLARLTLPDIILMDINLPGINGLQALQILAKDPLTSHIPVIAVSANAIPSDIEKGLEAGFFRYLTKPININIFMNTLDIVLEFSATNANKLNTD